jgi:hypothetical protein
MHFNEGRLIAGYTPELEHLRAEINSILIKYDHNRFQPWAWRAASCELEFDHSRSSQMLEDNRMRSFLAAEEIIDSGSWIPTTTRFLRNDDFENTLWNLQTRTRLNCLNAYHGYWRMFPDV